MKADRPINLDLSTLALPVAALTSILHRISGILFFAAAAFGVWFLHESLGSPAGFDRAVSTADHWLAKLILWGSLSALAYHFVAGVRHLIMDIGIGETLESGRQTGYATFVVSVVLIILSGVWVW